MNNKQYQKQWQVDNLINFKQQYFEALKRLKQLANISKKIDQSGSKIKKQQTQQLKKIHNRRKNTIQMLNKYLKETVNILKIQIQQLKQTNNENFNNFERKLQNQIKSQQKLYKNIIQLHQKLQKMGINQVKRKKFNQQIFQKFNKQVQLKDTQSSQSNTYQKLTQIVKTQHLQIQRLNELIKQYIKLDQLKQKRIINCSNQKQNISAYFQQIISSQQQQILIHKQSMSKQHEKFKKLTHEMNLITQLQQKIVGYQKENIQLKQNVVFLKNETINSHKLINKFQKLLQNTQQKQNKLYQQLENKQIQIQQLKYQQKAYQGKISWLQQLIEQIKGQYINSQLQKQNINNNINKSRKSLKKQMMINKLNGSNQSLNSTLLSIEKIDKIQTNKITKYSQLRSLLNKKQNFSTLKLKNFTNSSRNRIVKSKF